MNKLTTSATTSKRGATMSSTIGRIVHDLSFHGLKVQILPQPTWRHELAAGHTLAALLVMKVKLGSTPRVTDYRGLVAVSIELADDERFEDLERAVRASLEGMLE